MKSRINPERGEGYDEYINRIGDLVKGEVKSVKRAKTNSHWQSARVAKIPQVVLTRSKRDV